MEFDPYANPLEADGVCGRCGRPVDTEKAHSKELILEADHFNFVGDREFDDLMMMLDNWGRGYMNLAREGVDWSLPHELFEDFTDKMVPYIIRLKETGYGTPDRMIAIGNKVVEVMDKLIKYLQSEEDVLRLGGAWTDKEQEIKEYWEKKGERVNAYLSVQMPNVRRIEG
jgi:hypothetical protein